MYEYKDKGITTISAMVLCVVAGVTMFALIVTSSSQREAGSRLIAAQSDVVLSAEERSEYKESLASFVAGDAKPLDRWVKRLADAKRWGILPALPADYDNPHILTEDGKFILCPEYSR